MSQPNKTARTLVLSFAGVYLVAVIVYMIESTETQTGLFGYLMAVQMHAFGVVHESVTAILGMFLCLLPVLCLMGVIEKFYPGASGLVPTATTPVRRLQDVQLSWKHVLMIPLIPLVAMVVIGTVMLLMANSQNQKVYKIDLEDKAVSVPKGAVFVELNAILLRGYVTGYREETDNPSSVQNKVHVYAPLAGPGWTPAEPVRYFVHHVRPSSATAGLPPAFHERGPARFPGKLGGSLPVVATQAFESKGLKIAPGYAVVDWTEIYGDQGPTSDRYDAVIMTGVVGGLLTLVLFGSLVGIKMSKRGRMSRRVAH
jgi:hypothetical protein